jgi:DNA-binding transcriptional ArsR family regulator
MPNQSRQLDRVFQALADPTRRAVLERLAVGSAAVNELFQPFDMALPSFTQHLKVLSDCGLVQSQKNGRVRTYALSPLALQVAEQWIGAQRTMWEARFSQLDAYLNTLNELQENTDDSTHSAPRSPT